MPGLTAKVRDNIPYFLAVIALVLGFFSYQDFKYALNERNELLPMMRASATWPAVSGTVVRHEIYEKHTGRLSHSPSTHYFAEPWYRYVVGDQVYEHWRVCYDHSNCNTGTTREHAQALLDQYPMGSKVTVRYAPDDPGRAVLRPGVRPGIQREIQVHWIMGTAFALGAIVCVVLTVVLGRRWGTFDKLDD